MKKPNNIKIVMNAMVGSEENTITRMLESVADYIDYYVVQCNGNDNTKQIIDDFFAKRNIPGFTYEIEWKFPGWNRDHTLQECLKANHGCDWILRMDADEQLSVADDFDWSPFENLSIDSFNITADAGDSLYFRTWLWNAHRDWYFTHDQRHETIHLPEVDEEFSRFSLDKGFRQIITNDGETWMAPMKFLNDALTLEKDKVLSNQVLEDDYHLFYIGKSYSDSYGNPSEFPFGEDHAKEYARRAIFYFTMFLDRVHNFRQTQKPSHVCDMSYYAMYLIAEAYTFMKDSERAMACYKAADEFSPRRNESIYRRAEIFEANGNYGEMLKETTKLVEYTRANPFPDHAWLLHNSAYYDSSPLPLWMHIKALKANGFTTSEVVSRLEKLHNDLPEYITKTYSSTNQTINSNILSGVFGATK